MPSTHTVDAVRENYRATIAAAEEAARLARPGSAWQVACEKTAASNRALLASLERAS